MRLRTIPAVPRWEFRHAGIGYQTDAEGVTSFPVNVIEGLYERLEPLQREVALGPDSRARFARWHGGRRCDLVAAFDTSFRVDWVFKDPKGQVVPPETLGKVTLKSSVGVLTSFRPGETTWLQGGRVVKTLGRLTNKFMYHSIERVELRGQNVVNRAQQRIFPHETRVAEVTTLFFEARVHARDAFFGSPIGHAIEVRYPDGSVTRRQLDGQSAVTLESLPRGEYHVTVEGSGLPIARPVALSRDQDVDLKVMSYLDLGVLALLGLIAVGLLVAVRWRHHRLGRTMGEDLTGAGRDSGGVR